MFGVKDNTVTTQFIVFLNFALYALMILIIVEVIITNFIAFGRGLSPYNPFVRTLRQIVNPMLEPFRRLLPPSKTGGWDFSPMILILLLSLLRGFLNSLR
jgi:YggT family protein